MCNVMMCWMDMLVLCGNVGSCINFCFTFFDGRVHRNVGENGFNITGCHDLT